MPKMRCSVGLPATTDPSPPQPARTTSGPHAITRRRHLRRGFTEIGQCLGKVSLDMMRQLACDYAAKSAGDNRKDRAAASRTSRETLTLLSPPPLRGRAGEGVSLHRHDVAQLIPLSACGSGTATPSPPSATNVASPISTPAVMPGLDPGIHDYSLGGVSCAQQHTRAVCPHPGWPITPPSWSPAGACRHSTTAAGHPRV